MVNVFLDVICVCWAHSTVFIKLPFSVFFSLVGFNPVFDETFEFHINLPDLALVRFVVQDDDFIGDGFIGQYTMPLNCIQPGNSANGGVSQKKKISTDCPPSPRGRGVCLR